MRRNEQTLDVQRKNAYRLLRAIAFDLRRPYALFCVATLVISAASFLSPQFFLMFTENAATISSVTIADFMPRFVTLGLGIAVVLGATTFANTYLREWFQLKVERYLRMRVLVHLNQFASSEIDGVQRGEWMTSVTRDLRNVERFIAESLPGQLRSLLILFGTAALFVFYSHWMAVVPIAACVLIVLLNTRMHKRIEPLMHELRDLHGNVVQGLLQSLEGHRTIRGYQAEEYQAKRFDRQLDDVERKGLRVARGFGSVLGSNDAITQILTTLSLTFIMMTLAKGEMSLAAALAYPFYLGLFYNSAEFLAGSLLDWNEFFVSGSRVADITKETREHVYQSRVEASLVRSALKLELEDVSFGHHAATPLKSGFNFSIRRGEIVVILGPSGTGKSTFLEVLSGLRPGFSGRWRLHAPAHSTGESLFQATVPNELVSYVEQKPYIFEGSIRDNLLLGADVQSDMVWQALEDVNLAAFVHQNGGVGYVLQDNGQNLSEGQRYRLALARALLRDRPFLVLDEPFAALDARNAALVSRTLQECKASRGVVLVTHVVPSFLQPDRVVELASWDELHETKSQVVETCELAYPGLESPTTFHKEYSHVPRSET